MSTEITRLRNKTLYQYDVSSMGIPQALNERRVLVARKHAIWNLPNGVARFFIGSPFLPASANIHALFPLNLYPQLPLMLADGNLLPVRTP